MSRMWTSVELCHTAQISYRQLDHWVGLRILEPAQPAHGSGSRRLWDDAEVAVATLIGRLIRAGLTLSVAAKTARKLAGTEYATDDLGDGILVYVDRYTELENVGASPV